MNVGIVGAGAIGRAYAAILANHGHTPSIWAPRGGVSYQGRLNIKARGKLNSDIHVAMLDHPQALSAMDVIVVCVLGNGHKAVMDTIAPYLCQSQTIVISSHSSLVALYLSKLLALRGLHPPILAFATTVAGARIVGDTVHIPMLRNEIDLAAIPRSALTDGLPLLNALFGPAFVGAENVLAVSLSNLNPQIHLANAMLNYTRIENGEQWDNFLGITASVGRLIEQLDQERLTIAKAFKVKVRTVHEHYQKSYDGMPAEGNVHQMAQAIAQQRPNGTPGPVSLENRYLTEDLPFGIVCNLILAQHAKVAAPLHEAGLAIMSVATGRKYNQINDILPALGLNTLNKREFLNYIRNGWGAQPAQCE